MAILQLYLKGAHFQESEIVQIKGVEYLPF